MFRRIAVLFCIPMLYTYSLAINSARCGPAAAPAAIISPAGGSSAEKLAAKEVRRYMYLRTGTLPPIVEPDIHHPEAHAPAGPLVVVARKDRPEIAAHIRSAGLRAEAAALPPEGYLLKTVEQANRPVLLVVGGDEIGTLYGAYRLAELMGVRFFLHGDVVPDKQVPLDISGVNETGRPLFALRGIQPFHDFPEGPDWWSRDGYKAVLGQLPKLGMNFFGLHCYPQGGVGPEPLAWIGPPREIAPGGKVRASYPARHFTTMSEPPAWGYRPCKTGDFAFGVAELFDRDDYGANYMRGTLPWSKQSPEQCNALFDRMGEFLGDVFTYARRLGVKTCIGTETPLTIPTSVKERLQAEGKNPADPAVVQEVYEGMFRRIAKIHPLDYYWFWTPEGWTWDEVKQSQIDSTLADLRAAIAAAKKVQSPFTLATCGWVLGPPQSPALFDETLPKDMPMSCISRQVGNTPVEPGFAKIEGRPKWAIPWLEDDPGMTLPQLWVGRMRRDAADALKYGCTGLMGIHWRTRILAPNVSALAKAGWNQSGWTGKPNLDLQGKSRFAPAADFYADWTGVEFGPEAGGAIAEIFNRLDGRLPRPADWVNGPGGISPDARPWSEVQKEYAFVDELAAIRPRIEGAGNLDRFDYWLNNFRALRSIAEVRCAWGRFNAAMGRVKAEKDAEARRKLARESALPLRKELVAAFAELHRHLLAAVSNPGEMGNLCNWQQHTMPVMLAQPGRELSELLGEDLPAEAMPSMRYAGPPRLFLPEVRTGLVPGEPFRLTVIALGGNPREPALLWRPLGKGSFTEVPLVHVARGVFAVELPAEKTGNDFEYFVRATIGGRQLTFPPTAPRINQTVVVCGR